MAPEDPGAHLLRRAARSPRARAPAAARIRDGMPLAGRGFSGFSFSLCSLSLSFTLSLIHSLIHAVELVTRKRQTVGQWCHMYGFSGAVEAGNHDTSVSFPAYPPPPPILMEAGFEEGEGV